MFSQSFSFVILKFQCFFSELPFFYIIFELQFFSSLEIEIYIVVKMNHMHQRGEPLKLWCTL